MGRDTQSLIGDCTYKRKPDRWRAHQTFMSPNPAIRAPASSSQTISEDEKNRVGVPIGVGSLRSEQIREVIRLFQCPRCSYLLENPVTLPCGKAICKKCIPETHIRAHISYPATASRMQGFDCPFAECGKEHALGDCELDVVLSKTLANVRLELEKQQKNAKASQYSVDITEKDEWAVAGISSLHEPKSSSHVLGGGRLLATYSLAQMGELGYTAEASYAAISNADQQGDYDYVVLEQVKATVRTEMDCQVCYALYYDPLTTPCGHTFCRRCLQRVLDHASYCPVCRRPLAIPHVNRQSSPPNDLITKITTAFWADELELRKQAVQGENVHEDREFNTSVFVCTLAFPRMPTFLHVFEPRYRLMIRRALEGDRTFGMVLHQRARTYQDPNFTELGTLLRIVNVEFFPDGRSLIETIGVSRFRIVRHSMLDGYVVAKTEKINDISVAEEEELEASETRSSQPTQSPAPEGQVEEAPSRSLPLTRPDLETMSTRELMDFVTDFVKRMREQSVGWLTARILAIYGECPDDPAVFPWWFASTLPLNDEEKYRLLATTSVRERLKICCAWAIEWEASRWSFPGCNVL